MYKIIIKDLNNNILDKQHYHSKPSQEMLDKAFFDAVKQFQTFIFVESEQVKYSEL